MTIYISKRGRKHKAGGFHCSSDKTLQTFPELGGTSVVSNRQKQIRVVQCHLLAPTGSIHILYNALFGNGMVMMSTLFKFFSGVTLQKQLQQQFSYDGGFPNPALLYSKKTFLFDKLLNCVLVVSVNLRSYSIGLNLLVWRMINICSAVGEWVGGAFTNIELDTPRGIWARLMQNWIFEVFENYCLFANK